MHELIRADVPIAEGRDGGGGVQLAPPELCMRSTPEEPRAAMQYGGGFLTGVHDLAASVVASATSVAETATSVATCTTSSVATTAASVATTAAEGVAASAESIAASAESIVASATSLFGGSASSPGGAHPREDTARHA